MKIAHIADTHIKNLKYHDEYRQVFSKIYDILKQQNVELIIHCGDIAHTKTQISPEFVEMASDFFKNLSEIAPTYVILGNHDKMKNIVKFGRWESVHEYGTEIGILDTDSLESRGSQGYQKIIMSHYPILSWNKAHHGSWHLHGHSHGALMKSQQEYYKRKVMDVGCNLIDYTPISYEKVKGLMVRKNISAVDRHGED